MGEADIFSDGALRVPATGAVAADRLAGDYAFYDDGWQATLGLSAQPDGSLRARFHEYNRNRGEFEAAAQVNGIDFAITVRDFNELPQQHYHGLIFTRRRVAIAGTLDWKGTPFGFFAARRPAYTLGPLLPETVLPEAFLGCYSLYCDGEHATLTLSGHDGDGFRGSIRETVTSRVFPVTGYVDPEVAHRVILAIAQVPGGLPPPRLTLLMFVQRRTAMAGWLDWGPQPLGCFAIRQRP
jgi:hypothetical protein